MERERRTKRLEVRLSDCEFAKLKARACARQMRAGTYTRTAALGSIPPTIPPINCAALAELQRLGGNINQISHHLNRSGGFDFFDAGDLRKAIGELRLFLLVAKK